MIVEVCWPPADTVLSSDTTRTKRPARWDQPHVGEKRRASSHWRGASPSKTEMNHAGALDLSVMTQGRWSWLQEVERRVLAQSGPDTSKSLRHMVRKELDNYFEERCRQEQAEIEGSVPIHQAGVLPACCTMKMVVQFDKSVPATEELTLHAR